MHLIWVIAFVQTSINDQIQCLLIDTSGTVMSEIENRVRKIVVNHLGLDEDQVVDDASFIDDLGADSLDIVELIMAFEEEFGIEIPDDQTENIRTVSDVVEFLKTRLD